jgi:hypothetical protein
MRTDSLETLGGITAAELADLTGVHLATARRWKRTGKCPRTVERLVRVCHRGELDDIHRTWRGWRLVRGELISPEDWRFTPGAVRSVPLLERQVKDLQRERRFIAQADWVAGRYATPAVEGSGD